MTDDNDVYVHRDEDTGLGVGDTARAVIQFRDGDDQPIAFINGKIVVVKHSDKYLEPGDTIDLTISDVQDNKFVATYFLDNDGN